MVSQFEQRFRNGKKAQAMVEFALAFPIVMILVLGMIEGGWLMFVYSSLTAAGREAARYGAGIGTLSSGTILYNDCAGIKAAAIRIGHYAGIQNSDIHIYHDNGLPTTDLKYLKTEYCTAANPTTSFLPDDRIVVKIDINYRPITPMGLIPSFPLQSQNAHTVVLGAAVVAVPCDVSKYSVSQKITGKTDTITVTNNSGKATSIVKVYIKWNATNNGPLISISGIPGLTTVFPSAGPSYSSSAAMNFPPGNSAFTLTFSNHPNNNVTISLTLAGESQCVFGQ